MRKQLLITAMFTALTTQTAAGLSLAPEEFTASRALACVLAQQSLGYLSEKEYGARTHSVLEGFEESEKDNILSKALGYVDGLMFSIDAADKALVDERLQDFASSESCGDGDYYQASLSL